MLEVERVGVMSRVFRVGGWVHMRQMYIHYNPIKTSPLTCKQGLCHVSWHSGGTRCLCSGQFVHAVNVSKQTHAHTHRPQCYENFC